MNKTRVYLVITYFTIFVKFVRLNCFFPPPAQIMITSASFKMVSIIFSNNIIYTIDFMFINGCDLLFKYSNKSRRWEVSYFWPFCLLRYCKNCSIDYTSSHLVEYLAVFLIYIYLICNPL